jgi:hypothetical protein
LDKEDLTQARIADLNETAGSVSLLRSASASIWSSPQGSRSFLFLRPRLEVINNSALPYSRNQGALWAGKGWSSRTTGGVAARFGVLRIVIAPELTTTQNRAFPDRREDVIASPPIPPSRSPFSFPWYATGPYSVDVPVRFGDARIRKVHPGQSSILATLGKVTVGFATENHWWGPGIDNALVLSNNAPGFPHLVVRSSQPLSSRLGNVDFRWLVGELTESDFFDFSSDNDTRSIAAAAVTLKPRRIPALSIGIARSVVGTSGGWGDIPFRWLDVLRNTAHPNDRALSDSSLYPGGRDQLYSVFGRFVPAGSGAEVYGEWGRTDLPKNLRDLFVQPNRGQAYTLGLQWTRRGFRELDLWHLRAENTSLELGPTFRQGSAGVWYTSRRVVQGYTNRGHVLGAAVGPGSSGQAFEINYIAKRASFGVEAGRTRYNEDVHHFAPIIEYLRWCTHDVGLQWGLRGAIRSRFGDLSARALFQRRYNAFFQGAKGCPRSEGQVDIRNNSIAITFAPFAGR